MEIERSMTMFIYNRNVLGIELLKVKEVAMKKDHESMRYLFDYYHSLLKCNMDQYHTTGFITAFSPDICYHLLSVHFILDYIDHFYDGTKVWDKPFTKPLLLQHELGLENYVPFHEHFFEEIVPSLTKLSKLTKNKLNIFFFPYQHSKDFLIEYTILGDILVIFSSNENGKHISTMQTDDYMKCILQGVSKFYLKKELRNNVPYFFKTETNFTNDLINWFYGKDSLYFHK